MPTIEPSLIDSTLLPSAPRPGRQMIDPFLGLEPARPDGNGFGSDNVEPAGKGGVARNLALLSPAPRTGATEEGTTGEELTFTDDDGRACPRDPEEFRLAVALELDRLRTNRKFYI